MVCTLGQEGVIQIASSNLQGRMTCSQGRLMREGFRADLCAVSLPKGIVLLATDGVQEYSLAEGEGGRVHPPLSLVSADGSPYCSGR